MAGLRYVADDGEKLFALGQSFTIGRDHDNDLVVHDQQVSRRHATIRGQGDKYLLEDSGSRHGTYVQRGNLAEPTRVKQPAVLHAQDIIRIGRARIVFDDKIHFRPELDSAPALPASTSAESRSSPGQNIPEALAVEELTGAFPPTQPGRVLPILLGGVGTGLPAPGGLDSYAAVLSAMTARIEELEDQVAQLEAAAAKPPESGD